MSEWISVKDKKPKDGEWVIILEFDDCWPPCDDAISFCTFKDGHFWYNYDKCDPFQTRYCLDEYATHWMPLPSSPEVKP